MPRPRGLAFATVALALSALAFVGGVILALIAAVQGGSGGGAGFIGILWAVFGGGLSALLSVIAWLIGGSPEAKRRAVRAFVLGAAAPIVTIALVMLLVPRGAFRI